jgi:predicted amidohydrolase YtcJ
MRVLLLVIALLAITGCNENKHTSTIDKNSSPTVYYGGDIITMEGNAPQYADAVTVKDGKILFVGSKEEAMNVAGEGHKMIDLEGKTMLPGFIDGHAHFFGFGAQSSNS